VINLDTHLVDSLHAAGDRVPEAVRRIEGAGELKISPMGRLELQCL